MNNQILLINTEQKITFASIDFIIANNYAINFCDSIIEGLYKLKNSQVDLIVLLIKNAKCSDAEIIIRLKNISSVPIIVFTHTVKQTYLLHALELGVSDYLSTCIEPREALARININIAQNNNKPAIKLPTKFSLNNIVLCSKTRTVYCAQKLISLTGLEFELLYLLMSNAGLIVSREVISNSLFNKILSANDRSLDMHISNLRKKITRIDSGKKIQTVRTKGYIFLTS
jgi:two-component system, OmpR family, response regulator CpxR